MPNTPFTSRLSPQELIDHCTRQIPQFTLVRKSEDKPILQIALYRVKGEPDLTWICVCGKLWTAVGRDFRDHLKICPRAISYKDNIDFEEDTSDGTTSKMNAIELSAYQKLNGINGQPEFGKISHGNTSYGLTLKFHHHYIFACGTCGKRCGGVSTYDSINLHQKKMNCVLEDKSIVKTDLWEEFQNNLEDVYIPVPAKYVKDIKIEQRKAQQTEKEKAKKIKLEEKSETKRRKIEAKKQNDEKVANIVAEMVAANNNEEEEDGKVAANNNEEEDGKEEEEDGKEEEDDDPPSIRTTRSVTKSRSNM